MDPVRPLIRPFGAPSPRVGKVGRSAVPPSHPPKPMYFSMMSKGTRVPVALHTLWKP